MMKNIWRHQLTLIEENDEDSEMPISAIDDLNLIVEDSGEDEEEIPLPAIDDLKMWGEKAPKEVTDEEADDVQGEVNPDGACHKFYESEYDEFDRIGDLFNPESKTMLINGQEEFSTSYALKMYGISMQGLYGDNKAEEPSMFDLVEKLKWTAYEKVKGMDRREARKKFVTEAKEQLAKRGFSSENPNKARIDAEYEKCVAKKMAEGKSEEEIEAESHVYEKQQELLKRAKLEAKPVNLALADTSYSSDYLDEISAEEHL